MDGGAEVVEVARERKRQGASRASGDGFCLEDFHGKASHRGVDGSGEAVGAGADDVDLAHRAIRALLGNAAVSGDGSERAILSMDWRRSRTPDVLHVFRKGSIEESPRIGARSGDEVLVRGEQGAQIWNLITEV